MLVLLVFQLQIHAGPCAAHVHTGYGQPILDLHSVPLWLDVESNTALAHQADVGSSGVRPAIRIFRQIVSLASNRPPHLNALFFRLGHVILTSNVLLQVVTATERTRWMVQSVHMTVEHNTAFKNRIAIVALHSGVAGLFSQIYH